MDLESIAPIRILDWAKRWVVNQCLYQSMGNNGS